jgi:hypothetical protein
MMPERDEGVMERSGENTRTHVGMYSTTDVWQTKYNTSSPFSI